MKIRIKKSLKKSFTLVNDFFNDFLITF